MSLRSDLEEMAISLKSGSTKGRHVTGIYDVPVLEKFIKNLMLELVGEDITAIDHSDQSPWGEDYKRTHDAQVEYHNAKLRELRKKIEAL